MPKNQAARQAWFQIAIGLGFTMMRGPLDLTYAANTINCVQCLHGVDPAACVFAAVHPLGDRVSAAGGHAVFWFWRHGHRRRKF